MLELVDLTDRAGDKFSAYSHGMKQRLGLAAALLKDPGLLILDEPTNGLDPAGMAEMRVLIRRLADEGRTVLLSSHLLGEIEQICDRVGVISQGRLVAERTVAGTARPAASVLVRGDPLKVAAEVAAGRGGRRPGHPRRRDAAARIEDDRTGAVVRRAGDRRGRGPGGTLGTHPRGRFFELTGDRKEATS